MPNSASTMRSAGGKLVDEGFDGALALAEFIARPLRRGRGRRMLGQAHHAHVAARFQRQARQHVAVAAVVARPADHDDALRLRPMAQRAVPGRAARAAHQLEGVAAQFRGGARVERAGGFRVVQREGRKHRAILYLAGGLPIADAVATCTRGQSRWRRRFVRWPRELGFQRVGIAGVDLSADEGHLRDWLTQGPVRVDGLDGAARRQAFAPRRADPGHGAGDFGRAGLRTGRRSSVAHPRATASAPMSRVTRWAATITS